MKPYNYSDFKLSRLTEPRFKHILLLLYWPIYGAVFFVLEALTSRNYNPIHSPLDDLIPFCEFFLIPYIFWFASIAWIIIYSFFFDVDAFKKFHYFVIITYSVACITYIVYPSMQELRPEAFVRDNIFVDIVKAFYDYDTNTNVFPSVHVMGAFAVFFTAWHSKRYSTLVWRVAFSVMTVLVVASTVFMKQHSILDVFYSLVVCIIAYPFIYRKKSTEKAPEKALSHK